MTKSEVIRTEAKAFISDQLLVGVPDAQVYNDLKEIGITRTPKQPFTRKEVKELIGEVRAEWVESSSQDIAIARAQQLREIGLIKRQLHASAKYRELAQFIKLETQILGTDIHKKEPTTADKALEAIAASARIQSLELARERENEIIGDYQIIEDQDYVDSVTG